jgi:hypothetical protein
VHHFFQTPYFLNMPPLPDALPTLTRLHAHFTYHIVTARQLEIEPQTREWVQRHYPGLFDSILFGNHFGLTGGARSKREMVEEIGARVLIDDSATHARAVSGVVDWVILFDKDRQYGWNKGKPEFDVDMPANVVRLHSWREIEEFLVKYVEDKTAVQK